MAPRPTCNHCGEVIGVYERMIVVLAGEARETSRAAESLLVSESHERYHRSCYLERGL